MDTRKHGRLSINIDQSLILSENINEYSNEYLHMSHKQKARYNRAFSVLTGGEGGIRTLDTLLTYTPLAGARLQPLGHFSVRSEMYYREKISVVKPSFA